MDRDQFFTLCGRVAVTASETFSGLKVSVYFSSYLLFYAKCQQQCNQEGMLDFFWGGGGEGKGAMQKNMQMLDAFYAENKCQAK